MPRPLSRPLSTITPQALKTFANQARRRVRTESGGYRRDHLRALAQCVEVDAKEIRIKGSKGVLLRTLVAISSVKTAGFWGPPFLPKRGAPPEFHTKAPRPATNTPPHPPRRS